MGTYSYVEKSLDRPESWLAITRQPRDAAGDVRSIRRSGAAAVESDEVAEANAPTFDMVYRQMRSLAGAGAPDLLDLVQVAAAHVFASRRSFEGRCAPSTWTWQICYRTLLKQRRWYRRWLARFTLSSEGELPERQDDSPSAAQQLEASERALRLREAVARLSPKRRAAVVLHDLEGLSVEEISLVMNVNILTVRSRIRDGRRDLAILLRDDPYFGDEVCSREAER